MTEDNTTTSTAGADTGPRVTIVVTPRERFGVALESLKGIIEHTQGDYKLIYIDGNTPEPIATEIRSLCQKNNFEYIRYDYYLSPNQARNIGQKKVDTPYVVFTDNDVIPSDGWLQPLLDCADETQAEVVAPLTCQKRPLHTEIHQAGGEFAADLQEFLDSKPEDRRITDIHVLQGKKVAEVELERGTTHCCEFHCTLVRKDVFERFGDLDENLMATKEHLDFCMTIWTGGGKVMFEPKSIVTYLFPNRSAPLEKQDYEFFTLRWSPKWLSDSLNHFQKKWHLENDPYFEERRGKLDMRHSMGIAVPMSNKIPLINKSYKTRTTAQKIITQYLKHWSNKLAEEQKQKSSNRAA